MHFSQNNHRPKTPLLRRHEPGRPLAALPIPRKSCTFDTQSTFRFGFLCRATVGVSFVFFASQLPHHPCCCCRRRFFLPTIKQQVRSCLPAAGLKTPAYIALPNSTATPRFSANVNSPFHCRHTEAALRRSALRERGSLAETVRTTAATTAPAVAAQEV